MTQTEGKVVIEGFSFKESNASSLQRGDYDSQYEDDSDDDDEEDCSGGHSVDTAAKEVQELAKKESASVEVWRRNVFITSIAAAITTMTLTYWYLQREIVQEFETVVREEQVDFL